MILMLLVPLIPILALVVQNVTQLNSTIAMRDDLLIVERGVVASNNIATLVSALQEERSGAVVRMMTNLDDVVLADIKNLGINLPGRIDLTDSALDQLTYWPSIKEKNEAKKMFKTKLR